jgi:hypothetical protein
MQIVTDAVFAGKHLNGLGIYRFENISKHHTDLLKSINASQRRRYVGKDIIPLQVLLVWRDLDYLPGQHDPERPIKIKRLLSFLKNGPYRDRRHYLKGQWLYEKIVQTELMPLDPIRKKRVWPHRSK